LFYAGLPIYANTVLEWTTGDLGVFLAYSSLLMLGIKGPVLSRLSQRVSSQNLVLIGSALLASSFFLLLRQDIVSLYTANTLLSIGNGLMWPSFLALLSATGNSNTQGAIQGYGTSMGSIASMLGLVIGGTLFESFTTWVFVGGGVIFLVITTLLTFQNRSNKTNPKPAISH
jgi:MFS family permease